MTPEMITRRRAEYPGIPILMHPEAPPEVAQMADELLSTGGILRFVRESAGKEFIIATEIGIMHRLQVENPDNDLYFTGKPVQTEVRFTAIPYVYWNNRGASDMRVWLPLCKGVPCRT
jgi:quinolinate synthase